MMPSKKQPGSQVGPDTRASGLPVIVGATVAMALGFGGLALISVFMRPLEAEFGWSRSEISLAYALASIGMALGGVVWGRVLDRTDIRILLAIGGTGMVVALLAMAMVQSLWQTYLAHLVFSGFGFAVLYAPLLSATGEWFNRRRGLAVGVVTAGGALGQGVLPFLANMLIDEFGWRFAFVGVAAAMLIALALALPYIRYPAGAKVLPGQAVLVTGARRDGEQLQLVILSAAALMCCACMGVPLVHLASFVSMVCGSPTLGATSLLVAMLSGTVGRICFGAIADRLGCLPSYALASAMQTACVAAFPLLGDGISLLTLSAAFGFGFAGNMTCLVLCVREAVPAHRFGSALGMVMLVAWAGMGIGGYAAGALYDIALSYTVPFILASVAGIMNLIAISALMLIRRPAVRAQHDPGRLVASNA
jgi:MFS family permease